MYEWKENKLRQTMVWIRETEEKEDGKCLQVGKGICQGKGSLKMFKNRKVQ